MQADPPPLDTESEQDQGETCSLAPAAPRVMLLGELISALIIAGLLLLGDLSWTRKPDWWPLARSVPALIAFGLLCLRALIYPTYWYRAWSYSLRPHDMLVCHGVWWKTRRSVPRHRIQHVDIRSGPIDRMFGLCSLTLFTAGSGDEDAAIPGLLEADAESLRDRILHSDAPGS